jgi:hypothetical protein
MCRVVYELPGMNCLLPRVVALAANSVTADGPFLSLISTREIACIRHSSRYAEFWQNHFLQNNPDDEYSNDCNQAFHGASSRLIIQNVRERGNRNSPDPGRSSRFALYKQYGCR